jgi:hypothetical protein
MLIQNNNKNFIIVKRKNIETLEKEIHFTN